MVDKLCVFCHFLEFDMGSAPFSDQTPGEDARIGCGKGKWMMKCHSIREDFVKSIRMAKDCELFEPETD